MLDEAISQLDAGVQSLIEKSCPDCGSAVYGKTNHRQYCDACRNSRKLAKDVKAAEKQRRKNGIAKVKGETFKCTTCGDDFVASSGGRVKYCENCAKVAALDGARERSFARGADSGRKRVGRTENCVHCKNEFVVETRGQAKYCTECNELSTAGKLPHLVQARNAYARERGRVPKHALNNLMRGGILKSISDKGGRSWQDLVDYTVEDLFAHIERQFEPGMTWENRGLNGWHIDHRLPLSSFNFSSADDPEFKAAWSITNLQPMWGDENIRKKDQILYLL